MPKNFVGKPFSVSLIAGTEKVWIRDGGASRFPVQKFLSHSAENFPRVILYCCNNFGYRESLDKRRGGGVSSLCVEGFLSHSAKKVRRGTF